MKKRRRLTCILEVDSRDEVELGQGKTVIDQIPTTVDEDVATLEGIVGRAVEDGSVGQVTDTFPCETPDDSAREEGSTSTWEIHEIAEAGLVLSIVDPVMVI
jgi:hypothetical protein